MCFVWIWEQTAIISLYSINWLVFITDTVCVYCAVRTGYLYIIQANLSVYRIKPRYIFSYTLFLLTPRRLPLHMGRVGFNKAVSVQSDAKEWDRASWEHLVHGVKIGWARWGETGAQLIQFMFSSYFGPNSTKIYSFYSYHFCLQSPNIFHVCAARYVLHGVCCTVCAARYVLHTSVWVVTVSPVQNCIMTKVMHSLLGMVSAPRSNDTVPSRLEPLPKLYTFLWRWTKRKPETCKAEVNRQIN
jgi:hypothetical protein